jgi:molecular chaperone HtpG
MTESSFSSFQVDLRGIVDLLSHHLYASPRVYVRELLQNAVDAITARRAVEPDAPAWVRIEPPAQTGDGTLRVHDCGIGLTEPQVHELLATIGRSSKRDDLGFARHEFLGQFGIGLLSCFLVADEIRVETRSGDSPTIHWIGYADGRYSVERTDTARAEPGTTVTLIPRRGAQRWLAGHTVTELVRHYGSLLPFEVSVGGATATDGSLPWRIRPGEPDTARRTRLVDHAREIFGFTPFDIVDLRVPEAGLTGVAFVAPSAVSPAAKAAHRVYLKRMLLAENTDGLLPDWAFFARCVVDTSELRPTASREALYQDELLDSTKQALGDQLRGWLIRLATGNPDRLLAFLNVHHLGIKTLALHDDEMLRLVEQWCPMETNTGTMTLAEFRDQHGVIRYCVSDDEFRQLAGVAAAQNLAVVNGGYACDAQIIERLAELDVRIVAERLEPSALATRFDWLDPDAELALHAFLNTAQAALDRLGCEVTLRAYEPAGIPALYLIDRAAALGEQRRRTREQADDLWAGILDAYDTGAADSRPQLVLNHRNPLVRRIVALPDPGLVRLSVEALYGQALLIGHHPLRPADTALLNRSFLGLLDQAVGGKGAHEEP